MWLSVTQGKLNRRVRFMILQLCHAVDKSVMRIYDDWEETVTVHFADLTQV